MKLGNTKLGKPNVEIIIFPRSEGDIVLKARAIPDMKEFDTLCPEPKPPTRMYPGGQKAEDVKDEGYLKEVDEHNELRVQYMVLQSLKETEELEWETVDEARPATWGNYVTELKEAGLSEFETNRVLTGVMAANGLDEERITEARSRFLASQKELGEA